MPRQLHFRDERQDPESLQQRAKAPRHALALILDGIENPRNTGAIFRLADAALVRHIYCYDMGEITRSQKFQKAARSTHRHIPCSYLHSVAEVQALKDTYQLVGLEITDTSLSYTRFSPAGPVALIIGNEKRGISQELLDLTEACIHIPMYGVNTSMNVAMAAGIAVYDLIGKLEGMDGR